MSFNGSFGDCEFQDEEDNTNIISLKQEDFKINFEEGISQKESNIKIINNNEFKINYNAHNIFNSIPMETEINNKYKKSNIIYDSLLLKELINHHLSNIFNIIKSKVIIIYYQTFDLLKRLSSIKINNLIKAEILFFKMSGYLYRISKIFSKKRKTVLFHVFNILKNRNCISNNNYEKNKDNFLNNYEIKYKKEKVKAINENNNNIKILEKDIQNIEKKIGILTDKESKLTNEINVFFKKEKLLTNKIKTIENSTNSLKKCIESSNLSSINPNKKSDSEISSLEVNIKNSEQLKNDKKDVIKNFMEQVNNLLDEYQIYIDNINKSN